MKIIILGVGRVGGTLAELLASEDNDITVVDSSAERLAQLQEKFDLRTVTGHAAYPNILEAAGIADADLLVAVTSSDETNMLACQVAYTLFQTPTKIARVRSSAFSQYQNLFHKEAIPVDVIISPEALVTHYISQLVEYPGAFQVLDFADGRVQLVGTRALSGGSLVNSPIAELRQRLPTVQARIVAIYRQKKIITVTSSTMICPDDEVFFFASKTHVRDVITLLRPVEKPYKRLLIAGAGHIGSALAEQLENRYHIKIIEKDPLQAKLVADKLNHSIVLHGDASDRSLLLNENIEDTDIFCALTNDDEDNIMSAILAKRLGARKVMALINRTEYAELVEGGDIDIAISPQQTTVGILLSHLRRGDVVQAHALRKGTAEAIEVIAHGNPEESKVVGRRVEHIALPKGAIIGAIVRDHKVIMARHDQLIAAEDHLIMLVTDKRAIVEVEKLFQVGLSFF